MVEDERKAGMVKMLASFNHNQKGSFGGRTKGDRAVSILSRMVIDGKVVDRRED
jgi:hypothetical protein